MAYIITGYCSDENIISTSVTIRSIQTYTYYYGDSSLGDYQEFYITTDYYPVVFSANVKNGYSFYRWVYRVGSDTSTVQYSYDPNFSYSGQSNIYIRAEAKADAASWTLVDNNFGFVYTEASFSLDIQKYELHRIALTFNTSGSVAIYTSGLFDTYGLFGQSSDWNPSTGYPYFYLTSDDDSAGAPNFRITYADVKANTTYYLWVRGHSGGLSGATTVYIVPPSSKRIDIWRWEVSNKNASVAQTQAAYNAISNRGSVSDFPHLVWNDIVDKLKDVIDYVGAVWFSEYASYENAKMNAYDRVLTANRYNALVDNLDQYLSALDYIGYKNPGNEVKGWDISALTTTINVWILNLG